MSRSFEEKFLLVKTTLLVLHKFVSPIIIEYLSTPFIVFPFSFAACSFSVSFPVASTPSCLVIRERSSS